MTPIGPEPLTLADVERLRVTRTNLAPLQDWPAPITCADLTRLVGGKPVA